MALSTCVDCGGDLSTLATACPHCGRPSGRAHRSFNGRHRAVSAATGVLLLLVLPWGASVSGYGGLVPVLVLVLLGFVAWQFWAHVKERRLSQQPSADRLP